MADRESNRLCYYSPEGQASLSLGPSHNLGFGKTAMPVGTPPLAAVIRPEVFTNIIRSGLCI